MKKTDLTTKKVTNKPETGNTRKKKSLIRFSLEYAKETCVSSLLIFLFCIIPLGLMVFVSWMIPVLIPFALIAYSMIVYLVICFICEIPTLTVRFISDFTK